MDKKLEQMLYVVLGGALSVKEKLEANSEELRAWQEKSEAHARDYFDELAQRGEAEKNEIKKVVKELLKEVVNELDLATKDDLKQLKQGLER